MVLENTEKVEVKPEINGFVNLYKPAGFTSHDAVAVIRKHLPRKTKVGHTGTLDPDATGVLPICVGKGTRLAEYFTVMPKVYLGEMTLGSTTNTLDKWGEVTAEADPAKVAAITKEDVEAVLPKFVGTILQTPPMVSAIKINGKKLYELARQGKVVERPQREVTIYDLEVVEYDLPKVTMRVTCSGGTYIRTLFNDIGDLLGVGGHMSALERQGVGKFTLDNVFTLEEVKERLGAGDYSILLPMDLGIEHLPIIELTNDADYDSAIHGRTVVLGLHEAEANACKVVYQGKIVGIGETTYEAQSCACNEMLLLKMTKVLA